MVELGAHIPWNGTMDHYGTSKNARMYTSWMSFLPSFLKSTYYVNTCPKVCMHVLSCMFCRIPVMRDSSTSKSTRLKSKCQSLIHWNNDMSIFCLYLYLSQKHLRIIAYYYVLVLYFAEKDRKGRERKERFNGTPQESKPSQNPRDPKSLPWLEDTSKVWKNHTCTTPAAIICWAMKMQLNIAQTFEFKYSFGVVCFQFKCLPSWPGDSFSLSPGSNSFIRNLANKVFSTCQSCDIIRHSSFPTMTFIMNESWAYFTRWYSLFVWCVPSIAQQGLPKDPLLSFASLYLVSALYLKDIVYR